MGHLRLVDPALTVALALAAGIVAQSLARTTAGRFVTASYLFRFDNLFPNIS